MSVSIRLGVIGLGKMGISHLSIAGAHPLIEIVGVCDTSKMVHAFLSKQTPYKVFEDVDKMISDTKPEAVIIAVPTKYHYGLISKLLDNDIHVFSEKPLTLSAKESIDLAEIASRKGLVNQVGYHNQFIGTFIEMSSLIKSGIIGQVYHFLAESYGPVVTKSKDSTWRSKPEEGGGCLYDYASHTIDLVNNCLGEIVNVSGVQLKKIYSTSVEDTVYATLHLNQAVTGILSVNWSDSTYRKMSTKITVFGKNGKLIADATELKLHLNEVVKGQPFERGWNTQSIGRLQKPVDFYLRGEEYSAQIDYFINSIFQKRIDGRNSFKSAAKTDFAIELIREKNSWNG